MEFVLATSEVNRYHYRIDVNGIKLDNFKNNPILLYMHARSSEKFPIGRVDNLRIADGKLYGTPVFDEKDKMGAEAKRKIEGRFLFAVSISHAPIAISDDPALMIKGQRRPTVTETDLLEVSFVDIPGDPRAVKATELSLKNGESIDDILPEVKPKSNKMEINKMPALVLVALDLSSDATEQEIVNAIDQIKTDRASSLLYFGRQKGVVTDENEATYQKLAKSDFATTMELLRNTNDPDSTGEETNESSDETGEGLVQRILKAASSGKEVDGLVDKNDRSNWTFDDYQRKDPDALNQLRLTDAEAYEALANDYV